MKIKFQLILKRAIYPEHYLLSKLFPLVQAEASSLGDFDLATVRSWLNIDYFTAYDAVPNRKILGFTVDIPIPEEIATNEKETFLIQIRKLIDTPVQSLNANTSCFAIDLQKDTEIVETILRYEDDFMLADVKKYQPEIFEIEMKLREVLNYILAYNLKDNHIDDFLKEFEGSELADKKMNANKEMQRKRYREYFENELFHLVFSKYNVIHGDKQKQPKAEEVLKKIQQVNTFAELKESFYNITFAELDTKHATFLNEIQKHFLPIETMRNEIMHTRKPTVDNEQKYVQAKGGLLNRIAEFWINEQSKLPNIEVVISYLLDTIFAHNLFERLENDNIKFQDLHFQEQEMWVEEFKVFIFEQISEILSTKYEYQFTAESETHFYEEIEARLQQDNSN